MSPVISVPPDPSVICLAPGGIHVWDLGPWWMDRVKRDIVLSSNYVKIQSTLIICKSSICKFSSLLTFICNPQINTRSICVVIHSHTQNSKKSELPKVHVPTLASCLSSHNENKCPFFLVPCFPVLCFSGGFPILNGWVLASVPKHGKAGLCPYGRRYVCYISFVRAWVQRCWLRVQR